MIRVHDIVNLFYRALVVAIKPLLILCAVQLSDQIASDLAKVFIWTSLITPLASLSFYKTYMPAAISRGFFTAVPKIVTHTIYLFLVITVWKYALELPHIFVTIFTLDFFMHQISRVLLYQKRLLLWTVVNIFQPILLFALIAINSYTIEFAYILMLLISIILATSFSLMLVFMHKDDWMMKFEISQSFFGGSRKALISMDKVAASLLIENEKFWLIGILFQVLGASSISFDALKIMPKKKKIALKQLRKNDLKLFKANFCMSFISAITCFLFLFSELNNSATILVVIPIFLYRGMIINDLNVNLEFFFWKENLGLATAMIIFFLAVFCILAMMIYNFISYLPALFISIAVATLIMHITSKILNSGYFNRLNVKI